MTVFSIHFTLVAKIFHSLHVYTEFVCILKTLENPRISGVLFQGLEITWNCFFVLESPWFFIEQAWKILMFISFKWNESQWKQLFMTGNQSIKFLKCFETCTQGPLVTFVHVHWATSAQWMSGLRMFSSSHCLACLHVAGKFVERKVLEKSLNFCPEWDVYKPCKYSMCCT